MSIDTLKQICTDNKIPCEEILLDTSSGRRLAISMQKAEERTLIYALEGRNLDQFDEVPDFFEYRLIKGYAGIWSEKHKTVECIIDGNHGTLTMMFLKRKISEECWDRTNQDNAFLNVPSPIQDSKITIGQPTSAFELIHNARNEYPSHADYRNVLAYTTIRINNVAIKSHAEAIKLVKSIFSTICFNVNVLTDIPIQLHPEQTGTGRSISFDDEKVKLNAPRYQYHAEPLSMFWLADNLKGMPLQRYFSFYQAIEFYFTIYAEKEAQSKIRGLLKSPAFNVDDDKELSKVLNVIKFSKSSNTFGNELSQLMSTLSNCVNEDELKKWLSQNTERKEFFNSKEARKISTNTFTVDKSSELTKTISERIYNIRCRIVHTKGTENNVEVFHHLSNDAKYLKYDIELIEYICKEVIVFNGSPL
ncbi:hypothetical protein [Undibacterium sp. TC4M20W]|uniref:hypothetical protein n=1 Tax=Undibacterium sp. TC4M20W TaxID=3413052 RepID=UPI003BF55925